jgi:predicted nuclease with TOPRIM domain
MSEIMVNLKGTELGDFLKVDMISVESLVDEFEQYIASVEEIKEELAELKKDKWEREEDKRSECADMYYELERLGEF